VLDSLVARSQGQRESREARRCRPRRQGARQARHCAERAV